MGSLHITPMILCFQDSPTDCHLFVSVLSTLLLVNDKVKDSLLLTVSSIVFHFGYLLKRSRVVQ
jgi:hypothetical protein